MKVAVSGASGFLGSYVKSELNRRGHQALGWSRRDYPGCTAFDIARCDPLEEVINTQKPEALIHLAAISEVAQCQNSPALARKINVSAAEKIAHLAARYGLRLVHVSTNQVFDGSRGGWREDDETNPLNIYGETKLSGENRVLRAFPEAVILRPCLITGIAPPGRRSSTSDILDKLRNGAPLKMFTDETRSPVAASDVARVVVDLAEKPEISGLLHCGGDEALTRFEMASRLAETGGYDRSRIETATREEMGMHLNRPTDLSLDSSRLRKALGWAPRSGLN